MTTIHVITIQDHVIMTEEIMIDDQMMKILRRPIQDGEIWIRTDDQMTDQTDTTEVVVKADHVTDVITMDHVMTIVTVMMTAIAGDVMVMDHPMTDVDLTVVRRAVMIHPKLLKLMKHGVNFNHVTS